MAEQDQTVRPDAAPQLGELPQTDDFAPTSAPGPDSRKRRRTLLLTTAVVLGAGAIAAAVTLGPTAWSIMQQKDATLSMPDNAAGLTRDTSARAKETADSLMTVLAADIDLQKTASAIYADPKAGPEKSVMVFGGTALLMDPEHELDVVFTVMKDQTGGVTGIRKIDAGPLDGVMKCGSADSVEGVLTVCGWADHGSIALALFPGRSVDESAPLMRDIRSATLTR